MHIKGEEKDNGEYEARKQFESGFMHTGEQEKEPALARAWTDFDALLAGWSAALFPDPSPFWTTGAGFNYPGYSDPEVDALIARGLATRASSSSHPTRPKRTE